MKDYAHELSLLQLKLKQYFGAKATSASGECTIFIGPDKVDLTDGGGTVIARGPAKVATVIMRRKRRAK